jgi:hypothetical protein
MKLHHNYATSHSCSSSVINPLKLWVIVIIAIMFKINILFLNRLSHNFMRLITPTPYRADDRKFSFKTEKNMNMELKCMIYLEHNKN